jgi:hypothetical protein
VQIKKAVISNDAPSEIITEAKRKAMIEKPEGILYSELNNDEQKTIHAISSVFIFIAITKLFAATMMKEIETAGLNNLRFAWAGAAATWYWQSSLLSHSWPHYYY